MAVPPDAIAAMLVAATLSGSALLAAAPMAAALLSVASRGIGILCQTRVMGPAPESKSRPAKGRSSPRGCHVGHCVRCGNVARSVSRGAITHRTKCLSRRASHGMLFVPRQRTECFSRHRFIARNAFVTRSQRTLCFLGHGMIARSAPRGMPANKGTGPPRGCHVGHCVRCGSIARSASRGVSERFRIARNAFRATATHGVLFTAESQRTE